VFDPQKVKNFMELLNNRDLVVLSPFPDSFIKKIFPSTKETLQCPHTDAYNRDFENIWNNTKEVLDRNKGCFFLPFSGQTTRAMGHHLYERYGYEISVIDMSSYISAFYGGTNRGYLRKYGNIIRNNFKQ
jgi:hypothetical protein